MKQQIPAAAAAPGNFEFKYLVGSSVYGNLSLHDILPEVHQLGASAIDLWPKNHGTQREEADELGHEKLTALLKQHQVNVAVTTRYDLGPAKLASEFPFLQSYGARLVVTGAKGEVGLKGDALKTAVKAFVESMKPMLDEAGKAGIKVGIENHGANLIDSPDSVRWLADFSAGLPLGVAFAPYHLPQDPALLAELIRHCGDRLLLFYGWQFGHGCMKPMPRVEEHLQLPGKGPLDFQPLVQALRDIRFSGWTEVFMHPTPRGIPIMDTAKEVTAELNQGRAYLEACAAKTHA
jgi:sugar phosphate isomerase/epimerase